MKIGALHNYGNCCTISLLHIIEDIRLWCLNLELSKPEDQKKGFLVCIDKKNDSTIHVEHVSKFSNDSLCTRDETHIVDKHFLRTSSMKISWNGTLGCFLLMTDVNTSAKNS